MKPNRRTEKFWDMLSGKTDAIARKFAHTYAQSLERSRKYLRSTDKVLDFACGTGLICNEIAADVRSVRAIDISSKMLAIAGDKARDRNLRNIAFEKTDLWGAAFDPQEFDVVLAFNILHLVRDSDAVLGRLRELLTAEGYLITSTECAGENRRSPLNILVWCLIKLGLVPYMRFYTTKDLERQIQAAGFWIVDVHSFWNHRQPNHFIVARKRAVAMAEPSSRA